MLSPTHPLIDDCFPTGLRRRASGRGCVLCHRPISRKDGFGLSEGVCGVCVPRVSIARTPRIREALHRLITQLRRENAIPSSSLRGGDAVVHDTRVEDIRAA